MSRRVRGSLPDLGALLLVVMLGITYTDFMAVLVMWYGDVPSKEFWFVERVREPWLALAVAAFLPASLVPVLSLMFARVRKSRVSVALYRRMQPRRFGVLPDLAAGAGIRERDDHPRAAGVVMAALIAATVNGGWLQHLSLSLEPAHGR